MHRTLSSSVLSISSSFRMLYSSNSCFIPNSSATSSSRSSSPLYSTIRSTFYPRFTSRIRVGTFYSSFTMLFLFMTCSPLYRNLFLFSCYCRPLCILYRVSSVCLLTGTWGYFTGWVLLIWGLKVHSESWSLRLAFIDCFLLCNYLWYS